MKITERTNELDFMGTLASLTVVVSHSFFFSKPLNHAGLVCPANHYEMRWKLSLQVTQEMLQ